MRELAYERTFREWCDRQGVTWNRLRYPRPEAGGETLAYHLHPPGDPRAGVLVVHGAGNDAMFALTGLFRELLGRGYEVFSFDVDGHGRTSTTRFSHEAVSSSIPAALERWGRAGSGLPLHALGVSLGGALLLHALPTLSGTLASAALVSAPLAVRFSWRSVARELGGPVLRTLWRERRHYGLTGLVPSFGPWKRDLYPLRLAEPPGPGAFGYVEVLNRTLDALGLEEAARRTRVPVLLVYGDADLLVPVEQGRALARLLPRSELVIAAGETHLSTPLAPPAVQRLLAWFQSHCASASVS